MYEEICIQTWDEAKQYFNALLNANNYWIFRGHYKANWKLQPSLERILSNKPIDLRIESKIISEFKRRAHQYLSSTNLPKNLLEWLALMQHHGSPTRMLDWTKSPYVASFIAFENTYKEQGEVAIWAIDSLWLNEKSVFRVQHAKNEGVDIDLEHLKEDEQLIKLVNADVNVIFPLEPIIMNQRLTIQQALFLFPSGKRISFEKLLGSYREYESHKYIKKLIMPKSQGLDCLTDLLRMNINAATLFPGLDGFARSLRTIPDIAYTSIYHHEENIFHL
jgi:hypothetical protein